MHSFSLKHQKQHELHFSVTKQVVKNLGRTDNGRSRVQWSPKSLDTAGVVVSQNFRMKTKSMVRLINTLSSGLWGSAAWRECCAWGGYCCTAGWGCPAPAGPGALCCCCCCGCCCCCLGVPRVIEGVHVPATYRYRLQCNEQLNQFELQL